MNMIEYTTLQDVIKSIEITFSPKLLQAMSNQQQKQYLMSLKESSKMQ